MSPEQTLPKTDPALEPDPPMVTVGEGYRLGDDFEQLKDATIMMVDDEAITMEVVRSFLEDAGYTNFVLIDDSTQAIESLRKYRPDVLLLDVVMPEVSGFDILGELRGDPDFQHLPVIILTSSSDAATKLRALDLAATDFLSKPVDPSELALRVRNTLGSKAYQDQLAFYDLLTNLPNRRLFIDRTTWAIERAMRQKSKVAMLHIAFEDFKRVTDTLGPKVGDEVLRQLAERLTDNVRGSDLVSASVLGESDALLDVFRLGSADFSVLAPNVKNVSDAALIGRRILDAMKAPLDADGTDVYLSPSIGIAGFPEDSEDAASLIKHAAGASSQAFAHGAGRLRFYSEAMNNESLQRLRLEADLRRSVENGDFRLLYQPKVAVTSGEFIGAEALIRWSRQTGETVSPVEFIPIAEETNLILPIGEWVLETACRQMAEWRKQGIDLGVSVNISARQFFESDLVRLVSRLLSENQLEPGCLTLEMTESLLMEHVDIAIATLNELHYLGVGISIDDFGTGYSSLSYLKRFKVDEIKIDRSFIEDVTRSKADRALVLAVTYLAHELGSRVCAEGIETQEQLNFIRKVKCDEYQGFFCSRPIPAKLFAELYQQMGAKADA